jgi:hypothetical protein
MNLSLAVIVHERKPKCVFSVMFLVARDSIYTHSLFVMTNCEKYKAFSFICMSKKTAVTHGTIHILMVLYTNIHLGTVRPWSFRTTGNKNVTVTFFYIVSGK